jgi:hypothetical protein
VYPTRRVDVDRARVDNPDTMSDHAFQALMLWLICAQVFMSLLAILVFWYKTRQDLDQIQGVTAAVYLEVKRTLRDFRSNP